MVVEDIQPEKSAIAQMAPQSAYLPLALVLDAQGRAHGNKERPAP